MVPAVEVRRQQIAEDEVAGMLEGAELLEQDRFGPKIYALADGERMLKLFRVKRLLSSNLWSPYARRFVRNTQRLERRGIPTVTPLQWGRVPSRERQYVLYRKLEGTPLRDCADLDPNALGRFFARLHDTGIYFRSCHLGNILALHEENGGDQDFGLIDVLDMHFRRGPLLDSHRERNFRHLRRVKKDRERLDAIWKPFLEAYAKG